jgi:hypothetical protein
MSANWTSTTSDSLAADPVIDFNASSWNLPQLKHRPHLLREPVLQLGAAAWVANELDTEPNLGECDSADVKELEKGPSAAECHGLCVRRAAKRRPEGFTVPIPMSQRACVHVNVIGA